MQRKKTASEGAKDVDEPVDRSRPDSGIQPDKFEENFKELKKWVNIKSSKYGTLLVIRERRSGRLGTALKVCFFHVILGGSTSTCCHAPYVSFILLLFLVKSIFLKLLFLVNIEDGKISLCLK